MHDTNHKPINNYSNLPWSLLMASLGVVGTDGLAPRVTHLGIEADTISVDMQCPMGINPTYVQERLAELNSTLINSQIGFESLATDYQFRLSVTCGDAPFKHGRSLQDIHENNPSLLSPSDEGVLEWPAGVVANGDLLWDRWDLPERPALVIVGWHGSGRVALLRYFTYRIAASQADFKMWVVDTEGQLGDLKILDMTTTFVDKQWNDHSRLSALLVVLREARRITRQRSSEVAASAQGDLWQGERLGIVIGELAPYLRKPMPPEDALHAEVVDNLRELCRVGYQTGVHLIGLTAYPNAENLPDFLIEHSRVIGMAMDSSQLARLTARAPIPPPPDAVTVRDWYYDGFTLRPFHRFQDQEAVVDTLFASAFSHI